MMSCDSFTSFNFIGSNVIIFSPELIEICTLQYMLCVINVCKPNEKNNAEEQYANEGSKPIKDNTE